MDGLNRYILVVIMAKRIKSPAWPVALWFAGFAVIGLLLVQLTQAATYTSASEAESGSMTGAASAVNDPQASGGKFVRFGQPANGTSFAFTAAGDHGFDDRTRKSMDAVAGSGSRFYLALGDLSYSAGSEDEWCNSFKAKFNDVELIAGNHDVGESSGGDINRYRQFCPFTLGTLTGDYAKQYYFDYPQQTPLARFVMIAPGVEGSLNINYNSGGAGYNFTRDAIDSARASGIKWIIVGMHKNCISVGNHSCEIGTDIINLLITKKVDMVIQSHDHNYQRSHALRCITVNRFDGSCVADNGSDGRYVKGSGPVIIINGEFGRSLYEAKSSDSEAGYFAKTDSTTFGISKYTISSTSISGQYLRSNGANFSDSFTIQ